jgi:NH3-dependent NAD+ synthetase
MYLRERHSLGYECFVVGLSGGVDSTVCAQLLKHSVPQHTYGVIVDFGDADDEVQIAEKIASTLDISYAVLDGRAVYSAHRALAKDERLISRIHVRSRLITSMLFQVADNRDGLVVDTTDRSEDILCLYEEGQRGHVTPLIDLYKSELYVMAKKMGFGELRQSGCVDLDNSKAFGLPWAELDAILDAVISGVTVEELATNYGFSTSWLSKLAWRVHMQPLRTRHVSLRADGLESTSRPG